MNTTFFKKSLFGIIALLLVIFAGWNAYSEIGGVTQIYKNATAPFDDEKRVQSVMALPDDIIQNTRKKYLEALTQLTGDSHGLRL